MRTVIVKLLIWSVLSSGAASLPHWRCVKGVGCGREKTDDQTLLRLDVERFHVSPESCICSPLNCKNQHATLGTNLPLGALRWWFCAKIIMRRDLGLSSCWSRLHLSLHRGPPDKHAPPNWLKAHITWQDRAILQVPQLQCCPACLPTFRFGDANSTRKTFSASRRAWFLASVATGTVQASILRCCAISSPNRHCARCLNLFWAWDLCRVLSPVCGLVCFFPGSFSFVFGLTAAYVSSPRDWAIAVDSHMQQDMVLLCRPRPFTSAASLSKTDGNFHKTWPFSVRTGTRV